MEQLHKHSFTSTPKSRTLHLDREQATSQLEALGQSLSHAVYVRAFLPKEDPRYANDKGRKANELNWQQLERWQAQGYGIYIVVNGGGHKDEDVKCCRTIFCEFDDRPIEEQIWFWRELGLPEPSLQIQTRKSIHSYWVFEQPIAVEQWREVQTALLKYTGSDPALKNPSRVMRLAGAYHIKPGCDPLRCDIIHNSGQRYRYEELRAVVPAPQQPALAQPQLLPLVPQAQTAQVTTQYQRYEDIQLPVPASVPLEVCLARDSRTLLESGMSQGGRNTSGAKLARDLIGTANYLQSIGQQFNGALRLLLEDYANRCTPPLPAPEVDAIWKSAEKDRPGPSCKPEGVEACIRAWYWKHHVKPNSSATWNSNHHTSGRGFGHGSSGGGNHTPAMVAVSLCARIKEILSRHETESDLASALMDLADATGRKYNEISQLARILRTEGEQASEVIAAANSLQGILKSCRQRLDIRRYLELTLTEALLDKAAAMPTAPEYLFNSLLPACASRIGTASRIIINPEGGYKQPCIFWTANVAQSGQAKTPPQQEVLAPLEQKEAAAKEIYDLQQEDYESESDSNAKPPVRQRRLLNNVTTSTKIRIHSENPRGLLEYLDELVADYQRLNQYKSGKGDDLQLELSFWNGSGCNYDRHDARLFLKRTAFSKTGTYQWDTLARLMADEVSFIASGYSARFLYCSIVDAPPRYLDLLSSRQADTLQQKLYWLYGELEQLPEADYLLSHEAKVLFQGWNHTLVNAEIEQEHFGLSLVYAKIEAYTARIALWLHIVNAVLRGEKPLPVISGQTMQHAIEIASFYLWQHKLIHAHNAPTRQLEGIFLKVQTQAEKFYAKCSQGVGASFLKTRINALKSWAVEKIRNCVFKTLATAGHGRIEGEGSQMIYIPTAVSDASVEQLVGIGEQLVGAPISQNLTTTGLQAWVGEIGAEVYPTIISQLPSAASASPSDHQSVPSTEVTPAPEWIHQFTNSNTEIVTQPDLQVVGDPTNSPPIAPTQQIEPQRSPTARELATLVLGCSTWVELAKSVNQSAKKLMKAASCMSCEQRAWVAELLKTYLCSNPSAMSQLAWLPLKLRSAVLEQLTFTIGRIGGDHVEDARHERLSGCKYVSVASVGTHQERWIFQTPAGKNIPVFGTEAIEAIAATSESP
ncbi:DUF3987 domain-containing protein [Chroococcidiopsis sp. CCMEE 29]|uniref:DUF3987 domain-containing protein n=1 Tax=Chroococcidiopsis sp. CCMEE 29 TaxID=155894 RepID=UPI002021DAEA|nr:DUF3987 domain-containing protein [Chroococcidiopsis sp. CCMEE 29]